ncbi:hypothetical protein ACVMFA_004802 [Bradyrhizobium liaoningense]
MTISANHSVEHSELSLDNVSVSFPIYHGGSRSLKKSLLFRGSGGQLASDASHRITVEALRNVSMEFRTGDRVALIGNNGAGKTTLLRVMAGIYEPVTGVVKSCGRISPMFDISLGIDGDISGYDNIRLRGLILGLPAREIEERMADIAEFTELGDYLDIPAPHLLVRHDDALDIRRRHLLLARDFVDGRMDPRRRRRVSGESAASRRGVRGTGRHLGARVTQHRNLQTMVQQGGVDGTRRSEDGRRH